MKQLFNLILLTVIILLGGIGYFIKEIRSCPYCGSKWVCWNWIYSSKEDLNKWNYWKIFEDDEWAHECWDCGACFPTANKVRNGMPHWYLKTFYKGK